MRAPLLLLMAAASLAATPLARLNPWLSACDLEEEGAAAAAAARACPRAACSSRDPLAAHEARGLCAPSAADERQRRLRERRLRACCERDPLSALDARGRLEVAAGGARCERTLTDLIELDAMAARVHCAFHGILERYDCQQAYSVHTCDECQETYRRWTCSTLLPFFTSEEELERDHEGAGARAELGTEAGARSERGVAAERRARPERRGADYGGDRAGRRSPPVHTDPEGGRWRARHLERVGHLDRRRGGGVVGRWVRAAAAGPGRPAGRLVRLKPCLAVCQLVEQHCPYFLPGDRAPAYPTQYAGEPTFLCLDSRIPETGEQSEHSNYGADECCYRHCGAGICHHCDVAQHRTEEPPQARDACAAPEERYSTCVLPFNPPAPTPPPRAPHPPPPQPSRAARLRPTIVAALLAALLPSLLAAARRDVRLRSTRTDRTLFLVTNVHGARL